MGVSAKSDIDLGRLEGFATALADAPFPLGVREVKGDDVVHVADNRAMAELFDSTPSKLSGKSELELGVDRGLVQRAIRLLRRARERNRPERFELSFGVSKPQALEGTAHALPIGADGRELYVVLAQDVSELRKLQAETVELDRLSTAGVLAASVAHEVLNPAAAARFLCERAQALAGSEAPSSELTAVLEGIREGLEQIIAVASELRTFVSRRGRTREVVDLADVVASVLTLAGAQLGNESRIRVELRSSPEVRGDPIALRQLVLNLLQNAARAVAGRRQAWVRLLVDRADDGSARLEVHDDGPGFSSETLARAFSPLSPGSGGGSGLGLYVCKRIVDEHQGKIEVGNRDEGGARVSVTLPALISESV